MSVQLPWSTWVFLTVQLAISRMITTRSSYTRIDALKSSVVKVMGDILGTQCREIMLIDGIY